MESGALWESEAREALQDFIETDLSFLSVSTFACQLGIYVHGMFYEPMPATRLALVHGNQDYLASIDDISWIDDIPNVVSCVDSLGHKIFAFDLDCDLDEYYIKCAAVIKIYNVAFEGNNLFVFKLNDAVALGCKRKVEGIKDNFCVSMAMIPGRLSQSALGMLSELLQSEIEEFGDIIADYTSSTVYETEEKPVSLASIEDTDDLNAVFQRIYGFDFQDEVDRADQLRKEFWGDDRNPYQEARRELRNIGNESEETSYDALENARQAQEKAEKERWGEEEDTNENTYEYEDSLSGHFSRAAYGNAEIMLQEILARKDDVNEVDI